MRTPEITAWLRIARLQFYPMTWIAYTVGALAAAAAGAWHPGRYLAGYLLLFVIEFCTVVSNEYFDFPADRLNRNGSLFTGGSRVLVEGLLTFRQVRGALWAGLAAIAALGTLLALWTVPRQAATLGVIAAGLLLGFGYTVPPLQFSYRGLGEVVVGGAQTFLAIVSGAVFQGERWSDGLLWQLGVPLFFATLSAIILAGIPDRRADSAASKKTLAVLLGSRRAAWLAVVFVALAWISGTGLWRLGILRAAGGLMWLALPHGLVLCWLLGRFALAGRYDRRIDAIMQWALSYIIWFGAVPLAALFLRWKA